jgi:hypothetical protein
VCCDWRAVFREEDYEEDEIEMMVKKINIQ